MERLKDDAQELIEKGADKLKEFGSDVKSAVRKVQDKAEDFDSEVQSVGRERVLQRASDSLQAGKRRVIGSAEEAYDTGVKAIKSYPAGSFLATLGLGVVLGAYLFKGRK